MSSMIDTLAIAKQLQEAGDTPQHAEALANILGRTLQENTVTKHDLREAVAVLDRKIDEKFGILDHKIDEKFGILDHKITTHTLNLFLGLSGTMIAVVGIATTIIVTHIK